MDKCNGCKYLTKTYEFTQGGLVCHYHYICENRNDHGIIQPIERWSQSNDVNKPKWCRYISLDDVAKSLKELRKSDLKDKPDDKRTRRRICLRS